MTDSGVTRNPSNADRALDPIGKATGPDADAFRGTRDAIEWAMLPMTVTGLLAGLALTWAGNDETAGILWTVPSVVVAVRLAWSILRDLAHGELGVDLIAILAIVGALLLGEPFAAAVIGVMLATGEALERYAQGRAERELTALLGRAPRHVQRYVDGRARDDLDRGRRPRRPSGYPPRRVSCRSTGWSSGARPFSTNRR